MPSPNQKLLAKMMFAISFLFLRVTKLTDYQKGKLWLPLLNTVYGALEITPAVRGGTVNQVSWAVPTSGFSWSHRLL